MDWLLHRLRRGGERPTLVCYLRENGPIAYQTALFARQPRARAEAMLATPLAWYWKTAGRDWTELSRWSLAAFLSDLGGVQEDRTAAVLAIAVEPQDSAPELTDSRVAGWMQAFSGAAAGPLHAVVRHPAADGDLVFVAQRPPESIRVLLHGWAIDRGKAARRAYARLHGQGLEEIERSLADHRGNG